MRSKCGFSENLHKHKWSVRISNKEVCKKLNVGKSLLNDIKKRKLCYFGNIKRHSLIKKEILEGQSKAKKTVEDPLGK